MDKMEKIVIDYKYNNYFSARSKAREDVNYIAEKNGFKPFLINTRTTTEQMASGKGLWKKIVYNFRKLFILCGAILAIKRGTLVLFQYPFAPFGEFFTFFFCRCMKLKKCTLIFMVHDLVHYRETLVFDKYEIRAGTDVYKWLLATNETSYRDLGWAVDAAYHWGLESTYDLALSFSLQGGRRRHHSAYNLDFINPSLIMSAYRNIPLGTKSKIYAGIGAGVYGGIYYNRQYQHTGETKYKYLRTASYIAAGAVYWGQILDGVACFKTDFRVPVPAKSTIYSLLLPGLGQANNGDYWKIPIWTGGLIACGYFYHFNDMQYRRFRYITVAGANPETSGYVGGITASQAETYRDTYRRYRDYSVLAAILVYTLNVIDANVFAFMHDFDVSDNLAWIEVQPTVIQPLNPQYTWYDTSSSGTNPALGLQLQLTF